MTPPVVQLQDVCQRFSGPPEVTALRPTTLTVHAGDFLAIQGPSGAGKSTLLDILALLRQPSSGHYSLDGKDITGLDERDRCYLRTHKLGIVFQSYHLLRYRSALENVELAQVYAGRPPRQRHDRGVEILDRVGMSHRLHALPTNLSGGEQQRVAVARAMVNDPSVLLCDEPTGNLDSSNAAALLTLLKNLHAGGTTIVLITHADDVAAIATRQIRIHDGVVSEDLSP